MRYRRTTVALAALLAPLTFLAACGDDDDAATDSSTAESVADSSEAPADSTPDSTADSTETTPESNAESSGGGGDFCALLDDFNALDASTAEPEDLPDVFADFDDRADEFLDAAPGEIHADAELVIDSARQVKDVLESHDFDIAETLGDPEFMTAFSPEATEAQDRIDEWADANCS